MQRAILSKKNQITVKSGNLLTIALIGHFVLRSEEIVLPSLVIASVLGVAPIAIQAYQALRVNVVSIDVKVTIAVTGAFLIRNFEESAIVTYIYQIGSYFDQRTLNQKLSAIKELTEMAPESAL